MSDISGNGTFKSQGLKNKNISYFFKKVLPGFRMTADEAVK